MSEISYHNQDSDSKSYTAGYAIFLQRTNFQEEILSHFQKTFPLSLKEKNSLRILDIGCGNGKMTKRYLQVLRQLYEDIHFEVHLLEPSKDSLDKAQIELMPITQDITTIHQTADEYFSKELKPEFDLIIASYVFYHITAATILDIVRSLNKDGALGIMMGSKDHPLRRHPLLRTISKHGDSDSLKEILGNAREKDLLSTDLVTVKTKLDLNGLLNNGVLTEDGNKFFSFIYNTEMKDFPQQSLDALNSTLGEIFERNGGIVHPMHEMIWVRKR